MTSTLERDWKDARTYSLDEMIHKAKQLDKIIYGIDMSMTNPGMAELDAVKQVIRMYFFQNRRQEHNGYTSFWNGWTLFVYCIPSEKSEDKEFRVDRYMNRIRALLAIIGDNSQKNKLIGIEHYSYGSMSTMSTTRLYELGGCLRMWLHALHHQVMEIPPSTIKKLFSKHGQAKKERMLKAYQEEWKLPNLFPLIGLNADKYKHPPHPIEDMVDSVAVVFSMIMMF